MIDCKLSASIVLYNNELDEVKIVVSNFLDSTDNSILYLIDNSDAELDYVKKYISEIDRVVYIYSESNLGYGGGHNIAMKNLPSEIEYHLIMNADVIFDRNTISDLCKKISENDKIGLIAPKILNFDGSIQFTAKLLPTPFTQFARRFIPVQKIKDILDYNYELKFSSYTEEMNVPFIQGSFLLARRKVLEEVNFFDDSFFMYYEDVDLVRRIHKNYLSLYYPLVTINHAHNRGSYKNLKLLKFHIASTIKYFNKWGWIFDNERRLINKEVLSKYKF